MNLHQVLTGAVNPGDNCFSVGNAGDQPFTIGEVLQSLLKIIQRSQDQANKHS